MPARPPPLPGSGRRRQRLLALLLVAAVTAATLILGPSLPQWEYPATDAFFVWRNRIRPPAPPDDIVIVAIDEPSMQELGLRWPWPRTVHAALIDNLSQAGAAVIGFDILFAEPSRPAADDLLAAAMRRAGNVVLVEDYGMIEDQGQYREMWIRPIPPLLQAARATGLATIDRDADGFIRRTAPARTTPFGTLPSFASAVLEAYRQERQTGEAAKQQSGSVAAPSPNTSPFLIDLLGPPRTIPTVSYYQALAPDLLPADTFTGKIVLVGRALQAGADLDDPDHFAYPFLRSSGAAIPGVEIHAAIIDTLLRGRRITPQPVGVTALLLAVTLGLGTLALVYLPPWLGALGFVVAAASFTAGQFLFFLQARILGPVTLPLSGFTATFLLFQIYRIVVLDREKRFIKHAFKHYVAPSVVDRLLADPKQLNLSGEYYETTVLFTDLAGFTTISEKMEPMTLRHFLTEYFSEMVEVMLANQGTLDKFIGDALMCFFGVPVRTADHPIQALQCAWEMQQRLAALNPGWEARGLPRLTMRIGINTGTVVAGNMGTRSLFNYTIMGDTVNLASRLEGANKPYGTRIMVGEATHERAGDRFFFRRLDRLRVKGKNEPIWVFELLGPQETVDDACRQRVKCYEAALDAYQNRRFAEAIQRIETLLARQEDPPARLLLDRCQAYLSAPPPADWDGVFTMTSK
ncbi:MAG TPA: adenylate/guanylate cyclase domain-containing protein [Desulfobacterales bacterium]|nr:adenylate/guanylate cyclase domain-containing protein [Desulfobacterales bacterium]